MNTMTLARWLAMAGMAVAGWTVQAQFTLGGINATMGVMSTLQGIGTNGALLQGAKEQANRRALRGRRLIACRFPFPPLNAEKPLGVEIGRPEMGRPPMINLLPPEGQLGGQEPLPGEEKEHGGENEPPVDGEGNGDPFEPMGPPPGGGEGIEETIILDPFGGMPPELLGPPPEGEPEIRDPFAGLPLGEGGGVDPFLPGILGGELPPALEPNVDGPVDGGGMILPVDPFENAGKGPALPPSPQPEPPVDQGTGEVVVYCTSWCGYCKKAINLLKSQGVPFREVDLEKEPTGPKEKDEKLAKAGLPPSSGVPVIDFKGRVMIGYNEGLLRKLCAPAAK